MKHYVYLVIGVQLISLGATLLITLTGTSLALPEADALQWGNILSMGLIMGGLVAHIQARRGTPNLPLMALLGVAGPTFAYLGGPSKFLFGYHAVALGFHVVILLALRKLFVNQQGGGS